MLLLYIFSNKGGIPEHHDMCSITGPGVVEHCFTRLGTVITPPSPDNKYTSVQQCTRSTGCLVTNCSMDKRNQACFVRVSTCSICFFFEATFTVSTRERQSLCTVAKPCTNKHFIYILFYCYLSMASINTVTVWSIETVSWQLWKVSAWHTSDAGFQIWVVQ